MVNHSEPALTWLQTRNLCSWNFRAWLQQGTCGDGPGGVWKWLFLHYHATHGEKGEEEEVCTLLGTIHACAKIYGRLHGPAAPGNFHPPLFFSLMTCLSHDMSISYPLKFPYSPPFTDKVFLEHKLSLLHSLINE